MPRKVDQITAQWLGERVRDLMSEHEWPADSAYLLHQRSGVSERYAGQILAGEGPRRPRRETLEKLASAFQLSVQEFLGEPDASIELAVSLTGEQQDVLNTVALLDRVSLDAVLEAAVTDFIELQRRLPRVGVMLDALTQARAEENRTVVSIEERDANEQA